MNKKMSADKLINSYYEWLRSNTFATQLDDWIEIETPFLDNHNDGITIYIKEYQNKFILSDDGNTLKDLNMYGVNLKSPSREKILKYYLHGYGIKNTNGELSVESNIDDLPQKKHFLLQCIMAINDMLTLSKKNVANAFIDDIAEYFDNNDIRFSSNVKILGHSGMAHRIDFLIAKSKSYPERIIRAINNPTLDMSKSVAWTLADIQHGRNNECQKIVMLNDNKKISKNVLSIYKEDNIVPIMWSQRDKARELLAG